MVKIFKISFNFSQTDLGPASFRGTLEQYFLNCLACIIVNISENPLFFLSALDNS